MIGGPRQQLSWQRLLEPLLTSLPIPLHKRRCLLVPICGNSSLFALCHSAIARCSHRCSFILTSKRQNDVVAGGSMSQDGSVAALGASWSSTPLQSVRVLGTDRKFITGGMSQVAVLLQIVRKSCTRAASQASPPNPSSSAVRTPAWLFLVKFRVLGLGFRVQGLSQGCSQAPWIRLNIQQPFIAPL